MLCQKCEKKEAKVHLTKIINGEKTEVFLCEVCAEEVGHIGFKNEPFSFQNLLSGMLNPEISSSISQNKSIKCDTCGLSYKEFSEQGLFGCADCYEKFKKKLIPLVKRIHGSSEHQGKVPKRKGGDLRIKKKIEQLRQEMQQVVEEENFEKAADLRDEIHELEEQLESE